MTMTVHDKEAMQDHHADATTTTPPTLQLPKLSNPRVQLPANNIFELPSILTHEEANELVHAIDTGRFGSEWCNEGFDRRHRVQRYYSTGGDCGVVGDVVEDDGVEDAMTSFGWIFDRVKSRCHQHRQHEQQQNQKQETCQDGVAADNGGTDNSNNNNHSSLLPPPTLHMPFEVVVVEHTPSSCHSEVNIFAQNELCACQKQSQLKYNETHSPLQKNKNHQNHQQQQQQQHQNQHQCTCYTAQLTLLTNAISSFEKPKKRAPTCWEVAEPSHHYETNMIMEQNGVVIQLGDCLWGWRSRISGMEGAVRETLLMGSDGSSSSSSNQKIDAETVDQTEDDIGAALEKTVEKLSINSLNKKNDGNVVVEKPNNNGPLMTKQESTMTESSTGSSTISSSNNNNNAIGVKQVNGTWQRLKKLKSCNKRCITITFRGIRNQIIQVPLFQPPPSSSQCQLPSQSQQHEEYSNNNNNKEEEVMTVKDNPLPSLPPLPLSQLLTIIVTTSPIRSNPSTEMLERTFDTFHHAGEEFAFDCPKVIVCDGCRVREEEKKEDVGDADNGCTMTMRKKKEDGGGGLNSSSGSVGSSGDSSAKASSSSDSTMQQRQQQRQIQLQQPPPPKITMKHANVKQALRNGIATVDQAKNYRGFIAALRKLCNDANSGGADTASAPPSSSNETRSPFRNTTVVELEERHGYGFALRHALLHCVQTPYVCVIQHDRAFMRPTPTSEVVAAMRNDPQIKYVGMSMKSNLMYYDIFGGKYGRRAIEELKTMILRPKSLCIKGNVYGPKGTSIEKMTSDTNKIRKNLNALAETYRGSMQHSTHYEWLQSTKGVNPCSSHINDDDACHQLSLMPTVFWYDNTHIVQTSHYRDFVFDPKYKMVARGGFVEDKLSPAIIRNIERLGLTDGHAKFGCYLLDDHSGTFFTGHLDGGNYLTAGEKDKIQGSSNKAEK